MNILFTRGISTVVVGLVLSVSACVAQTVFTPPKNSYAPEQDVELGRRAAAQVEQRLPILRDEAVTSPIASLGQRLADSIPQELQHSEFRYSFQVVNVRDINAFALPGGPMFVNRGMIEAAHTEGEVAGVMAHELSHVALRHGTAQATKERKYEVGALIGAVVGTLIGGGAGRTVSQVTQFGLGTALLRFSREDERQADLLGSHIMARAGYDPREMANFFKTIEQQGGARGPQWLSDHPNPGNRYEYIIHAAQSLEVHNPVRDTRPFTQLQARLRQMPPATSTENATRHAAAGRGPAPVTDGRPSPDLSGAVAPPASSYTAYTEGNLFRVNIPSNWRELAGSDAVTFAPDGAYGNAGGQGVFTHGMEIGVARNETHDLRTATDELVSTLARSNPKLSQASAYTRKPIGGREGLGTVLSNVSSASGRPERVAVFTTLLRDGGLFYAIGVAPGDLYPEYEGTFGRVVDSVQLMD